MRRGELFGLKWRDVDLQLGQVKIVRSIIDQKVGETKTRGSKRPLPLPTEAVVALGKWKMRHGTVGMRTGFSPALMRSASYPTGLTP